MLQDFAQRRRLHAPLVVDRHAPDPFGAESEEPQRREDGDVRLLADHDVDLGCSEQAARFHVPACAPQQRVACSGERREVRHLATGHEADAGSLGKPEQIEDPTRRHFLDDGSGRRGRVDPSVLIPGRGQPIGSQSCGQAAADHEAEISGSGRGHQSSIGGAGERLDHLPRRFARLGQRASESGAQGLGGEVGPRVESRHDRGIPAPDARCVTRDRVVHAVPDCGSEDSANSKCDPGSGEKRPRAEPSASHDERASMSPRHEIAATPCNWGGGLRRRRASPSRSGAPGRRIPSAARERGRESRSLGREGQGRLGAAAGACYPLDWSLFATSLPKVRNCAQPRVWATNGFCVHRGTSMHSRSTTAPGAVRTLGNYVGQAGRSRARRHSGRPQPATGELLARVPLGGSEDVQVRSQRRKRRTGMARAPPAQRARYLFALKARLEAGFEELSHIVTSEHGKTLDEARGSVRRGIDNVERAAGIPSLLMGDALEDVGHNVDCVAVRQPLGVFAAVCPFNFPAMVPLWFLPYAIATGNTFVLKPSEQVPLSAAFLFDQLQATGLPSGVVNLVNGGREAVDGLLEHPGVTGISFGGSRPVAQYVYRRAAEQGKRVQSLGGAKNFIVVMPDADLDQAAEAITDSAFGNAGERCLAGSVVLAVGDVQEPLRAKLAERARAMKIGNGVEPGVTMGPLISAKHRERVLLTSISVCRQRRAGRRRPARRSEASGWALLARRSSTASIPRCRSRPTRSSCRCCA